MDVDAWLAAAVADAERRGLPELKPLLETLAGATRALRAAAWRRDAGSGAQPETADSHDADRNDR